MSYPRDLDEIPKRELLNELKHRASMKAQGRCDYCGKDIRSMPYCRFAKRHAGEGE